MRIIIYEDASVIIDELQVDLSSGDNTLTFQAPGYVPGTLYVVSEHRYTVSESTLVTVMKGNNKYQGRIIQMDDDSITISIDDQVVTINDYDTISRGMTEITLNIIINENNEDMENAIYYIPVVYTTDMISGDVRYFYDIVTEVLSGELLVDSEMNESVTANIGIGNTPLYSDLDTGDDVLEYSLLGEYTIAPNSQTSIPLDSDRFGDGDGVYALSRNLVDIEDEEVFMVLSLERYSGGDTRPPYPGILTVLNNGIPIAEREVRRDLTTFSIGAVTSLSVDTALDENGNPYVQIINNKGSDLPITVVYDDTSPGLPEVQVLSPDEDIIASSIERIDDEIQISFTTGGLGIYTVLIE